MLKRLLNWFLFKDMKEKTEEPKNEVVTETSTTVVQVAVEPIIEDAPKPKKRATKKVEEPKKTTVKKSNKSAKKK